MKNEEEQRHQFRIYNDPNEDVKDDLLPEYEFDYSKAKPNPYAARALQRKAKNNEISAAASCGVSERPDFGLRL